MKDKKLCKIYNLEGYVYIIPEELMDEFEITQDYDRKKRFNSHILPDEGVIEDVLIDISEYENIIDGWF